MSVLCLYGLTEFSFKTHPLFQNTVINENSGFASDIEWVNKQNADFTTIRVVGNSLKLTKHLYRSKRHGVLEYVDGMRWIIHTI